jgi:hypothetical protein
MKRTLLAVLILAGCGGEQKSSDYAKVVIPLDQVPENIRKIAENEFKDRKLKDAFKKSTKKDGKFVSYEIRAVDPKTGKTDEVGIAPDGKIVDRE